MSERLNASDSASPQPTATTMLKLESNLGLSTDLRLHEQSGIVEAQDGYTVVRTPDAPEYFFGNLLVLPQRPLISDLGRIERDFARLVGVPPRIAHRTFTWPESPKDEVDLDAFIAQGYDATLYEVLAAKPSDIVPVTSRAHVDVRPFRSQEDWDTWSAMQLGDMPNPDDVTSQRFMAHQEKAYQRLIERGFGNWWGAFIDGELAGSLGLFFLDGIGRFQSVLTGEAFRNQGICKTLVSEVTQMTAARANVFVMVADESYHAGKIYQALGFRPEARVGSLCREPA